MKFAKAINGFPVKVGGGAIFMRLSSENRTRYSLRCREQEIRVRLIG